MALTEWHPESHALLKNVSPACLLSSKIVWEAECQDTLVMHDHELVMKWPEIWRKLEKNILWMKHPENGHVFFLFCHQPSPQVCLLCQPGWMWCKFGRIIAIQFCFIKYIHKLSQLTLAKRCDTSWATKAIPRLIKKDRARMLKLKASFQSQLTCTCYLVQVIWRKLHRKREYIFSIEHFLFC